MQKQSESLSTLKEVDRQLTIETTSPGSLPDDKEAVKWINRSLAILPHSPIPYIGDNDNFGIIDILESRGRYPLLIRILKKAVADPKLRNNTDLLIPLADAEQRMGSTSDAKATYSQALVDFNAAMKKAGTTFGTNTSLLLDRARAEYYGGNRANAVKDFNSIIATDPDDASLAQNDLAYFYALDKTNLPEAKKLATAAVADARKDGDDDTIALFEDTLAWVEHQSGNDSDALYYEQEAASLLPLSADIQYHLGEISKNQGQYLQARIAFTHALAQNPFFPEARDALKALPPAARGLPVQSSS